MKKTFLFFAAILFSLSLYSQAGALDVGFGTNGFVRLDPTGSFNNQYFAMKVQPNGKIIVAGQAAPKAILMRLEQDGSYDSSFGNNGISLSHFEENETDGSFFIDIALQPDGKIVAVSYSGKDYTNFASMGLARFNEDGTLDDTFGQGGYINTDIGGLNERAIDMELQSDGKIVVLARTSNFSSVILARYNQDGSPDKNFGTNGVQTITNVLKWFTSLVIQPDGNYILGGSSERASNPQIEDFALTRILSDGAIDMSFGTNGVVLTEISPTNSSQVNDLEVLPDGKIIATGANGIAIAKFHPTGSLDLSFGNGGIVNTFIPNVSAKGSSVTIQQDGKIVVGANTFSNPERNFAMVRYLPHGILDLGFGTKGIVYSNTPSVSEYLKDIVMLPNGKILSGGEVFTKEFVLAQYLSEDEEENDGMDTIQVSIPEEETFLFPNPIIDVAELYYYLPKLEKVSIRLHSTDGKLLYTFIEEKFRDAGQNKETLDWPIGIHSGTYLIVVSSRDRQIGVLAFHKD